MRSAETRARLDSHAAETSAGVEVDELHTTAVEGGNGLPILVLVGIRSQTVSAVLHVGCPLAQLALEDVIGLSLAAWQIVDHTELEVDLLVVNLLAVSALGLEVPIFIFRHYQLGDSLQPTRNLQIDLSHYCNFNKCQVTR